jgi:branched-chain amino acid transport system ATP-binding protein
MRGMIACENLDAGYGDLKAVSSIELTVSSGEVVALICANGEGKTTTLLTLVGELQPIGGTVFWDGRPTKAPLHRRVQHGLAFIPEEKVIVTELSVRDNIKLGPGSEEAALALFPELSRLLRRKAGLLSGGEQQMLTLASALAGNPKAVVIDDNGVAVLVVEQDLHRALSLSDRFYLMRKGKIELEARSATYRDRIDELSERMLPGGAELRVNGSEKG